MSLGSFLSTALKSVSTKTATCGVPAVRLEGPVAATWAQGRALFGGFSAAVGVAGAQIALDNAVDVKSEDMQTMRSMTATFLRPISPGAVVVESHVLRVGKSVSSVASHVMQGDEVCVSMIANFGATRPSIAKGLLMPRRDLKDGPFGGTPDVVPPMAPQFLNNFDLRFFAGSPFEPHKGVTAGQVPSRLAAWVCLKDGALDSEVAMPAHQWNTMLLVASADVPPPIVLCHYDLRKGIPTSSTLSWNFELVGTPRGTTDGGRGPEYFIDLELASAKDGYSQQGGTICDNEGNVVALTHQTMVYFDPKPRKSN